MEPRELWERHAVLAQAFCSSDDEVRRTQGLLDEAEARRSRTLAAFAVTVGSDAVVAELLGLDEREVRLARRTVGKEDARAVAKSLLAQTTREQPPAQQTPTPPAAHATTPPAAQHPTAQHPTAQHPTAQHPAAHPTTHPGGPAAAPVTASVPSAPQASEPAWAPALDAVLMSSWHSGVDLTALATELGLDVRLLVARAQQLAAESRPAPAPAPDRTGRHRRLANLPPSPQSESAHTAWRERPSQPLREPYEPEPWKQHPYQNYPDQQEYQEYRVYEEHSQHQHQQYLQQQQHLPHPQHLQHPQHQQYQQPSHATWDANAITAAQHDWDGILSQWEATTSPTPPLSAPGQGGV
ncbi:hypothetical protein OHT20_35190 [Streptomyces caniferus]|uniref:Uncharacterized protein n=1 Tax=Streptomyces caniferus TaxID=285557 RepID=A0ABZ1VW50_9ACTN|nr:hypothetical protein [Streptomyces caniferus]